MRLCSKKLWLFVSTVCLMFFCMSNALAIDKKVNVLAENYISPNGIEFLTSYGKSVKSMSTKTSTHCLQYETMLLAMRVINNVKFNTDSAIYGKVGMDQYKKALLLIFGSEKITDAELKKSYKIAKRYVTNDGTGVTSFYDDLIDVGLMDSSGNFSLSIDAAKEKLGIGYDLLIAMLGELSLYQKEPLTWYRVE